MGLLDIWNDWKKENQSSATGFEDYMNSGNMDTAGGGDGFSALINRTSESPLIKNPIFPTDSNSKIGKYFNVPAGQGQVNIMGKTINAPQSVLTNKAKVEQDNAIKAAQVNNTDKVPMGMPSDPIVTGGSGVKPPEDMGFMQKLSNMAGVDFSKASEEWKEKGGFEGLMSNPAFTLGLALMQSSANGKTINQGILDNFVKSAKISTEFKDRIEARKQEPIQATEADIGEMKSMLERFKIDEPNIFEKGFSFLKGENATADYDRAVESIAIEYQKRIASAQKNNKSGKPLVIDSNFKEKILKDLLNSKDFKEKKGWFGPFTSGTLEKKSVFRAQGGPVESGKPYVVGEKGPEIIIPTSDGNVLSNDDSQIFSMLLASNPQLQKVSRQRAERVLRNRFPEYFEG